VLENDLLRIEVLPELCGKIWSIISKPRKRELLRHNPGPTPHRVAPGSSFDGAFFGGWDEVFPNDAPVTVDGIDNPDHGEIWTTPCDWRMVEQSAPRSSDAPVAVRAGKNGVSIDLGLAPDSSSKSTRFFYATELSDGWCSMIDLEAGFGVRFEFDRTILPAPSPCLGVWRLARHARNDSSHVRGITGYPRQLDRASASGFLSHLDQSKSIDFEFLVSVMDPDEELCQAMPGRLSRSSLRSIFSSSVRTAAAVQTISSSIPSYP